MADTELILLFNRIYMLMQSVADTELILLFNRIYFNTKLIRHGGHQKSRWEGVYRPRFLSRAKKSPLISNGIQMAGSKGRSGGARKGAGRPKKEIDPAEELTIATSGDQTPLEFLLTIMNDNGIADKLRLEAAKTAAQYVHPKKGESNGSKDAAAEAAKNASAGRFGKREPPKLAASGGKKI